VRRYAPDPQDSRQTQGNRREEGLQRAFAVNSARQQEIEPDQARILRLDCEANRKAKYASRDKPLLKKAPHGHHTKAHSNSGRIAKNHKSFAVGEKKANQDTGDNGRVVRPEIPNQKRGQ